MRAGGRLGGRQAGEKEGNGVNRLDGPDSKVGSEGRREEKAMREC